MRLHPRPFPDFAAFALTLALALFALASPPLHAQPGSGPISGGGGGGGLPGAGEVTESMLKAVDTPNDEEYLTYETTTGDFEWQTAIGGSTGATDDKLLCSDGVGGSTLGVCTVADIDNLRLDGNTISSTDANGNILLVPNGTGSVLAGVGTKANVAIGLSGDPNTGFYQRTTDRWTLAIGGAAVFEWTSNRVQLDNDFALSWGNGDVDAVGADTGLIRTAAGVVQVTDGGTGIRGFLGGGTIVASATALPVPTGRVFHISGTTDITSITSTNFQSGVCVTLIFDGILTFTDGSNLKLAGNFVTTADDTISLCYDGANWYETGRSIN